VRGSMHQFHEARIRHPREFSVMLRQPHLSPSYFLNECFLINLGENLVIRFIYQVLI
jgi:hypothetical protein